MRARKRAGYPVVLVSRDVAAGINDAGHLIAREKSRHGQKIFGGGESERNQIHRGKTPPQLKKITGVQHHSRQDHWKKEDIPAQSNERNERVLQRQQANKTGPRDQNGYPGFYGLHPGRPVRKQSAGVSEIEANETRIEDKVRCGGCKICAKDSIAV